METAIFGGGCFWCTEAVFRRLKGVASVMPGYAGGTQENPTYDDVCTGTTGHVEVVKVEFDPAKISYRDLLTVFFATHNPTTKNKQGNDTGTQYRSIILYTTADQKREAELFMELLSSGKTFSEPLVTELEPLTAFYPAEISHREYYEKNKNQQYCQIVIDPKLEKLKKRFHSLIA